MLREARRGSRTSRVGSGVLFVNLDDWLLFYAIVDLIRIGEHVPFSYSCNNVDVCVMHENREARA